jgi:hypothetical protein
MTLPPVRVTNRVRDQEAIHFLFTLVAWVSRKRCSTTPDGFSVGLETLQVVETGKVAGCRQKLG